MAKTKDINKLAEDIIKSQPTAKGKAKARAINVHNAGVVARGELKRSERAKKAGMELHTPFKRRPNMKAGSTE